MPIQRFRKILIANRGEIAVRIILACRQLNILSVAVYSTADRHALHVEMADEAVLLGGVEAAESYLNIDRIVDVAKSLSVDAIHPGYGFLAENPLMVEACCNAGITFIGPSVDSMQAVASKQNARELVASIAVPTIPGLQDAVTFNPQLVRECEEMGYPVLLKASAGGGGLGMRIVDKPEDLESSFTAVTRESVQAFGDDKIILEKYLANARHIEVQILADNYGNVIHLHERDCSMQRRRQKIIEESPARNLAPEMKLALCEAAVNIAKSIHYRGAATVEFLYSSEHQAFYFLEVNARLQVEHGVTEAVTGIDIVQWQIKIAEGETLTIAQNEVPQVGHAIECRVCTEVPARNFSPAIGRVKSWKGPADQRCDSGIRSGDKISIYYDSLVAKNISYGSDFSQANRNMQTALQQTRLLGVDNNLSYLKSILSSDVWAEGQFNTSAVESNHQQWSAELTAEQLYPLICAAVVAKYHDSSDSRWPGQEHALDQWAVVCNDYKFVAEVGILENDQFNIAIDESKHRCLLISAASIAGEETKNIDIELDGHRLTIDCCLEGDQVDVHCKTIGHASIKLGASVHAAATATSKDIVSSPMPAKIVAINVAAGERVVEGQDLLVLESMKMETSVAAIREGIIEHINIEVGQLVESDFPLMEYAKE